MAANIGPETVVQRSVTVLEIFHPYSPANFRSVANRILQNHACQGTGVSLRVDDEC